MVRTRMWRLVHCGMRGSLFQTLTQTESPAWKECTGVPKGGDWGFLWYIAAAYLGWLLRFRAVLLLPDFLSGVGSLGGFLDMGEGVHILIPKGKSL